jgi:CRP/FNR family transcriptional regulator
MYAVANDTAKFDVTRSTMCRGLAQPAVRSLMAISSLHRKASGEVLFAEGDEADAIYEVVRGTVRLCKLLPDGRRLITGFLSAGHLLGLAMEGECAYTAEAVTDVALCRYKRAAFARLIDEVPGLAKHLLAVASDELRAAQERMLLLGRKSATEKVASFLVLMAGEQGGEDAEEMAVPMTRSDIADYLGLTREAVCRTLTKLKQDGVIALPTVARIEIRDRDHLEDLAAGETEGGRSGSDADDVLRRPDVGFWRDSGPKSLGARGPLRGSAPRATPRERSDACRGMPRLDKTITRLAPHACESRERTCA